MRTVVGITAVILSATWVHAAAADPDLQPGVKTPTPSTAATDKKPKKSSLFTSGEKYLLRQGYKLEVRDGTKYFCRNEGTLGSRLHEHKVCGTEETIAHRAEANDSNVRDSLKKSVINNNNGH